MSGVVIFIHFPMAIVTLGPACNEQIDAKKTARCRGMLVVTELFNITASVGGYL